MFVKPIKSLLLGAVLAASMPSMSHAFTLDFEGVGSFGSVSEFYNGGFDVPSTGSPATGVNYGASFSGDALALSNDALGPYFSNAPTPGSVMFASGTNAVLNVAAGFKDSVSFYYSSTVDAFNVVKVYSGLNATGTVLARIALQENNIDSGCSGSSYCNWQQVAYSFAGVGKSIDFGSNAATNGSVAFDNVSISAVPELESYAMLLAGLGLMGAMVGRRKRD
jgi:hypothetical protein